MKAIVIIFLINWLLLSACKKENILTDGEKSAQQVQTILDANQDIKTASFYVGDILIELNQSFSINGQYVVTSSNSYNLSRLIRYQLIRYQDGNQRITFYF